MIGEQAKVPDTVKPCWQDMDQESTNELIGSELHGFEPSLAFRPIILPFEGDILVVIMLDSTV